MYQRHLQVSFAPSLTSVLTHRVKSQQLTRDRRDVNDISILQVELESNDGQRLALQLSKLVRRW